MRTPISSLSDGMKKHTAMNAKRLCDEAFRQNIAKKDWVSVQPRFTDRWVK